MKLSDLPIVGQFLRKNIGSQAEFDAYLLGKGCIIMPFSIFLSNPNMPVMVVTDQNAFKAYVDRWTSCMVIKAVYKQNNSYYIFNTSDALKITIS
jgi:hypothetical protein